MIVLDASAALSGLLNAGPARQLLAMEQIHAPHLLDIEVVNALRRRLAAGTLDLKPAGAALSAWRRMGLVRYPMVPHLERIWQLRDNVSAYDATYIALAEALDCRLITADGRLSRAPGIHCSITLVPR